jgi:hypothetical protein
MLLALMNKDDGRQYRQSESGDYWKENAPHIANLTRNAS